MVSAEVNRQYGDLNAAQIEYAPFGVASGLCVGLATTASQNEGLTLQPCTVPATTVWIVDTADFPAGYFTIINGSTTDFSRPFAMTYPRDQQAADQRTQQIKVRRLQFVSNEHTVRDRQLWVLSSASSRGKRQASLPARSRDVSRQATCAAC
jgi:hypothetical protein